MIARIVGCSFIVGLVAVSLVAAQPGPVDPYGGASYGGASYGYGGASYGYGGASYGGASYGYGGAGYGGASYGYGGAGYGGVNGPPAILAFDWTTGVVRFDEAGRRVVVAAPTEGPNHAHSYQPVVVDQPSGRWVITRQRKRAAAAAAAAPWTLLFGDRNGVTAEIAGDPTCGGTLTCFEAPLAFTRDGAAIMTQSLNRRGTTLGSYAVARAGRRALVGRSIATNFALTPAQDRAAYVSRGGLTLIDWTATGPRKRSRTTRVRLAGKLTGLAMSAEALFFQRAVTGRDRTVTTTIEAYDLATGERTEIFRPRGALMAWPALAAPARGSVLVHDCAATRDANSCAVVELTGAGARVMARRLEMAYDVSDDGRYLLAKRSPRDSGARATAWPDLVVIELSTGREVRVVTEAPVDSAQFTR